MWIVLFFAKERVMKKSISLLALFSAIAMLAGCCGCCGDKNVDDNKSKSHKVVKKDSKKNMSKKAPVKKESEFRKLRKDADAVIADM